MTAVLSLQSDLFFRSREILSDHLKSGLFIVRLGNRAIGRLRIAEPHLDLQFRSLGFQSPNGPITQSHNSSMALPDQNHVGIGVATNQGQLLAIERPVEVENMFGSEIRKLFAFGTIQRLEP